MPGRRSTDFFKSQSLIFNYHIEKYAEPKSKLIEKTHMHHFLAIIPKTVWSSLWSQSENILSRLVN